MPDLDQVSDAPQELLSYAFARENQFFVVYLSASSAWRVVLGPKVNMVALSSAMQHPLLQQSDCQWIEAQADFDEALSEAYSALQNQTLDFTEAAEEATVQELLNDLPVTEDLLDDQENSPMVRTMNTLLFQAIRDGASDVHIEPYEEHGVIRFRIDGVMFDVARPTRILHMAIVSRLKVMAQLDISERRLPQDGRISLRIAGRSLDVRISTLPTLYGERVVLRVLDPYAQLRQLEDLGFSPSMVSAIEGILHRPYGIFLVTGPTGAGKTTTLYAALSRLDVQKSNVMTVEDPVEYDMPGISQTSVRAGIGMNFARALRAILRQDPDTIMIGEIRDLETAQIAVQASLTGHMVLATLHTNSAISAIARLVDMGVEPFLLAPAIRGVLAQRLLRKLCTQCRRAVKPSPQQIQVLGSAVPHLYQAVGCEACHHTGYDGRVGVFEVFIIDQSLEQMIHDRAPEYRLREYARAHGVRDLREQALSLAMDGVTSLEEVLRVWREDDGALSL